jgi:hypothetical protein
MGVFIFVETMPGELGLRPSLNSDSLLSSRFLRNPHGGTRLLIYLLLLFIKGLKVGPNVRDFLII